MFEAIAEYRRVLELSPNFAPAHAGLGTAYMLKGMLTNSISEFETMRNLAGNSPYGLGSLGYVDAVSGRTVEARKVLGDLMGFLWQGYSVHGEIALIYNGLGDRESTLNWLDQGFEQQCDLDYLKYDPRWQNLRSEPRFIALLKKMGFEK